MAQGILRVSEAANLAVHALAYLAGSAGEPASATQIAHSLGISEAHLSKVLQRLVKAGYLRSVRGAKGGFQLSRQPDEVTVLDLLVAVDGPLPERGCLLGTPICPAGGCRLSGLLCEISDWVHRSLGRLTLAEVVRSAQGLPEPATADSTGSG